MNPTFPLGRTVITPNALARLRQSDIARALQRHQCGDWGDVCKADRKENDLSLENGFRLFSIYHTPNRTKFWIITEADRSATNVELHISDVMLSLQKC